MQLKAEGRQAFLVITVSGRQYAVDYNVSGLEWYHMVKLCSFDIKSWHFAAVKIKLFI